SSSPVPVTTDDWPYLYQEGRWIPPHLFFRGPARYSARPRPLLAHTRSAWPYAVFVLSWHGRWIPPVRDSSHKPACLVFLHDLAGKCNRDWRVAGDSAVGECGDRA